MKKELIKMGNTIERLSKEKAVEFIKRYKNAFEVFEMKEIRKAVFDFEEE